MQFPGNIIPRRPHQPAGPEHAPPDAAGERDLDPRGGQEWTSNSIYDLTPVHGRTNHVLRLDAVLRDKTRMNVKA